MYLNFKEKNERSGAEVGLEILCERSVVSQS